MFYSQAEFGDGQEDEAVFIGLEAVPLDEQVERGDGERQASQDIIDYAMHHRFEMADQGQHRKDGFDQHPVVPSAARAEFEIGRIAGAGVAAGVGQNDHAVLEELDERVKLGIVGVGRQAQPADDFALVVDQQAQFDPPRSSDGWTDPYGRSGPGCALLGSGGPARCRSCPPRPARLAAPRTAGSIAGGL